MNYQNPSFQTLGEHSILITWELVIDENLLEFILFTKKYIQNYDDKPIVEIVNTYSSLLISYGSSIKNIYDEILTLKSIISTLALPRNTQRNLHYLPVCYNQIFGLDLELLRTNNKLDTFEIIGLHTTPIYTVYFMGFLPGFLYLGGLDKRLFCPRKNSPRKSIQKGAVGIGGNQTGIYPKPSPGGWQIIGSCPLNFFDVQHDPPSVFRAGDKIKFYSISLDEHQRILKQVKSGNFQQKTEAYAP